MNKGTIAIAFQSAFANPNSLSTFQRITLNVVAVRINPSATADDFDPRWVVVPVPSGVGRNTGVVQISTGTNFGGNTTTSSNNTLAIGTANSEVQIDLKAITNIATIFNAANVPAQTYNQVELVLDSQTPGNMVPLCAAALPSGEGCIAYPAKLASNLTTPTPSPSTTSINAVIQGGLNIPKGTNVVTPLVVTIDPGIGGPPVASSDVIPITPIISTVPNTTAVSPFLNPDLGTLIGNITTNATGGFSNSKSKVETITAEFTGTNNIVESISLPNTCNGQKTCDFIMYLPALATGTNYDLVASGATTSYAVRSNITVTGGGLTDLRPAPLAIITRPTVSLSGKVTDTCTTAPIQAATLNLVIADPLVAPASCAVAPQPIGCVVAASAATDEVGNFPLPGNGFAVPPFSVVPLPETNASYDMITTSAGYDRTPVVATNLNGTFKCNISTKAGCAFTMNRGSLTGNVGLSQGETLQQTVMVVAEDTETNNIENLTLVAIPAGATTVPFTMNVPDSANVGANGEAGTNLDVFASAQDIFNGAPQTNSGHTIAVVSGVAAPAPPSGTNCNQTTLDSGQDADLAGITCVGHSSVQGFVSGLNPTGGDTVVISKSTVQFETVPVIPPGQTAAGNYTICAPADPLPYDLDHYQNGASVAQVQVTLPTPFPPAASPGATPCPSICDAGQGNACLVCKGLFGVAIPTSAATP